MERRELTNLALGVAIALVTLFRRSLLTQLPGGRVVLLAGGCLLVAWTATVAEHLLLPDWFNLIEHGAYFAQSLLLALWVWTLTRRG